jgi:hypothetical protein
MVRLAVVVSIVSLLAGAAAADEVIPTAQGATPPDASKEPPPPPLGTHPASEWVAMQPGPCGTGPAPKLAPLGADGEPQVDHSPHGEMYAGIGTHGYREVGGTVCVPVGKTGAVTVSVDQSRFGGGRWR